MTRIYTKSASTMSAGGLHYSADEKTVADVGPVSYSVFGDTTPQVFNGACNGPMMEDGFLSRFGNVQYKGNRPPYVANPLKSIPQDVVTHWVDVFNHADLMDKGDNFIDIQIDNEANKLLNDFNEEIDRYFVDITDDALRQSRTRAHLKALKIAGLLAAADNPYLPKVSVAHAEWAIDFIRREIAHYDELVNAGDLCSGNDSAERKLKAILAEYIGEEPKASYRVRPELRKAGIVTWSYMMTRTSALPQFQKVNNINPLKGVVANLISEGVLTPVKVFPAGIAARGECYYVDIH